MPSDCITYQQSGYFSQLVTDYLNKEENLKSLYNHFPLIENFKVQIEEKQQNYPAQNRVILTEELKKQYKNITASALTSENIELLKDEKTFTVTTGHQLNLFTGPLYFLYKIVSTINLCKELKEVYPDFNFVPVYWMATEDHDFEEISFFNFKNKKIKWNRESAGPVGRLNNSGLDDVLKVLANELGIGKNAEYLKELFEKAYLQHDNLAEATRYLANELFGDKGLVIIDGDSRELKRLFIPYVQEELEKQTSHEKVAETTELLKEYNIQVNPREINLFYIEDNLRERIINQDGRYYVNNTEIEFSHQEIIELLDKSPQKFSPNVIMRPLYQEVLLPNLCYIGGGGEIAYWLELKSFFKASGITFPMLLIRNSVLLATKKQADKLDNLDLTWQDTFSKQYNLINRKVKELSTQELDFTEQKAFLKKQFDDLAAIAQQTDASFKGAVEAQEKKQLKGLENLEKRLKKAEKKVHTDKLSRITDIQNELFPNQGLQERQANFSEFYLDYNGKLLELLFAKLKPLEHEFSIIVL